MGLRFKGLGFRVSRKRPWSFHGRCKQIRGFPKHSFGVAIVRILVYLGLYWGPPFWETRPNSGYLFGGPHNKDSSILRSILRYCHLCACNCKTQPLNPKP